MSVLIGIDFARDPDKSTFSIRASWIDANEEHHCIVGIGDSMEEAGRQFEFAARQIGCPYKAPRDDEWIRE